MAAASGPTASSAAARRFISPYPRRPPMEEFDDIDILLVEDNPLDAELTMRGLNSQKVANRITWLKDGAEALDYVFRRNAYAGRTDKGPRLILLDLKMPRVGGIEVTKALKSD